MAWNIWLARVICLVVPPPKVLCTPHSIHWGGRTRDRVRNSAGLSAVQTLFSKS